MSGRSRSRSRSPLARSARSKSESPLRSPRSRRRGTLCLWDLQIRPLTAMIPSLLRKIREFTKGFSRGCEIRCFGRDISTALSQSLTRNYITLEDTLCSESITPEDNSYEAILIISNDKSMVQAVDEWRKSTDLILFSTDTKSEWATQQCWLRSYDFNEFCFARDMSPNAEYIPLSTEEGSPKVCNEFFNGGKCSAAVGGCKDIHFCKRCRRKRPEGCFKCDECDTTLCVKKYSCVAGLRCEEKHSKFELAVFERLNGRFCVTDRAARCDLRRDIDEACGKQGCKFAHHKKEYNCYNCDKRGDHILLDCPDLFRL